MSLNSSANNNNISNSNNRYYQQYGGGLVGGNPYQSSGYDSGNSYQSYPLHYHSGIQPPLTSSSAQHPHTTIPNSPLNNHMIGQQQRNNFRSGYQLPQPPSASSIQGVSQLSNSSNNAINNAIKTGPIKRKSDMELTQSVENGQQIIKKIKTEGSTVELSSVMESEQLHPVEPSLAVYNFSGSTISKELDEKLASTHALLEEQPRIKPNYMALTSSEAARLQVDFFPSKFMTEGFINELKKDLFEDPNAFKRCKNEEQRRVFCMIDDLNKIMNVLKLDREMSKRKEQAEKELNKTEKEHRESSKRENSQTTKQKKNLSQRRSSSASDDPQDDSQSESDEVVSYSQSSRDTSARGKILNKKKNTKTLLRKSSKRLQQKRGGLEDDEEDSNIFNSYQDNDDDGQDQNDDEDNEDSNLEEKIFTEIGDDDQNEDEEEQSQNKANKKLIVRKKKEAKRNSTISNTSGDGGDGSGLAFRKGNRQKFLRIDDDDEKQEKSTGIIPEKVEQEQQQKIQESSNKIHVDDNNFSNTNVNTQNNSIGSNMNQQNNTQAISQQGTNSTSQMEIENEVKIENRLLKFKDRESQLANREAEFEKRQKMIMEKQQKIMYLNIAFTQAVAEHANALKNLEIVNNHFQLP